MKFTIYSEQDFQEIKNLHSTYGISIDIKSLPALGIVARHNKHGGMIAAGFLRRVEGDIGMGDTFITSPCYGSKTRNKALLAICDTLIKTAKALGFRKLIVLTKVNSIRERANAFGFVDLGMSVQEVNL
jgi:hypothetical protein